MNGSLNQSSMMGSMDAGLVYPASVAPLADGNADTRVAVIGTSEEYARADHIHPITRIAAPVLPNFAVSAGLTFISQAVYLTYSTEESLHYKVRVQVRPTTTAIWQTIVAPFIAGYQLVEFGFEGFYNGLTTPYPNIAFGWNGNTVYFAPAAARLNTDHYAEMNLMYVLN